jgi:hypothetical protein
MFERVKKELGSWHRLFIAVARIPVISTEDHSSETTGKGERTIRGFKMVHVFDVSQTEGEDLPDTAKIEAIRDTCSAHWRN